MVPSIEALWDQAEDAVKRADYVALVATLRTLADRGVWQLCARIGELYESGGHGLERDLEETIRWYRRAVFEGDDAGAHLGLGRGYFNGTGVEKNPRQAIFHFEKAYRAGRPEAALYLGLIYSGAMGNEANLNKAKEFLVIAAEAGFPAAYPQLARIARSERRYLDAMSMTAKGWHLAFRIARHDQDDPRLLGLHQCLRDRADPK